MGCFSSTCAITRTEIAYGDEVFVAFYKPNYNRIDHIRQFNTYDVMQMVNFYEVRWAKNESCGEFLYINTEEYDDYGCTTTNNVDEVYNKQNLDRWDYQFICHKSVAENMLGRKLGQGIQLEKDFFDLLSICFKARIEVYSGLLGFQHLEEEELKLQHQVLNETQRMLKQKHKQFIERKIELMDYDPDKLPKDNSELATYILYVIEVFSVDTIEKIGNKLSEVSDKHWYKHEITRMVWILNENGLLKVQSGRISLV